MTNPTPAERQREVAREVYTNVCRSGGRLSSLEYNKEKLINAIAAALARERREAWNEACEKCAGECIDYNDSESCRKLKQ